MAHDDAASILNDMSDDDRTPCSEELPAPAQPNNRLPACAEERARASHFLATKKTR
ncbi:MAG: hypothetical protein U0V48_00940 [Anaerolineales bacterium]